MSNSFETRGDVLIRVLWYRQTDAIIDVKYSDVDMDTYKHEPMVTLLSRWDIMNKDKHGKNCHYQQKYFSLFSIYIDGVLRREAVVVLANLS